MDRDPVKLQGFLLFTLGGESQKTFAIIQSKKLYLYHDDPSKSNQSRALGIFELDKTHLLESGDFKRPKSFGLQTSQGYIEFSCPTNSVRSTWIKALSESKMSLGGNTTTLLKPSRPPINIEFTPQLNPNNTYLQTQQYSSNITMNVVQTPDEYDSMSEGEDILEEKQGAILNNIKQPVIPIFKKPIGPTSGII